MDVIWRRINEGERGAKDILKVKKNIKKGLAIIRIFDCKWE
jgi:hypothetical protein